MKDISIIVPAYNEVESLPLLQTKIEEVLGQLEMSWQVIYIDDGSTDGTDAILETLCKDYDDIIAVILRGNRGKSQALDVGFSIAKGEVIITMDADLQDDPQEIPNLLNKLNEGYDIVIGWKVDRKDPLSKIIPSQLANTITRYVTGLHVHDMNSGLKAIRKSCVQRLNIYGDLHRYIPIIAYYEGFKVTEIPVKHHERQFGRSKYGPGRLLRGGLDLVTVVFLHNYGYRPLHLIGGIGAIFFALGFFINAYLAIEWLNGIRPIGDRPLLTLGVLLMVVGAQFLSTGLVAELIVAYIRRQENPRNIVKKMINHSIDDL